MAGLSLQSATDDVWLRPGPTNTAATAAGARTGLLGGAPSTSLPIINNQNLPPTGLNTQLPRTPFPPLNPQNPPASVGSNIYSLATTGPGVAPVNLAPNPIQAAQNEANQRRLMQLEDENVQRRNATMNLQQMGSQILQGQMDVQEQVLQYQFMLEQCMETLDHQNYILNEQAEELALLRAKMRHFEYLMDALKHTKEGKQMQKSLSGDFDYMENNQLCCRDPITLPPPPTSPFFTGTPSRATASTFQPFNPRYRSPNSRAEAAANLNERRSVTPSSNNANLPSSANRPSRRFGNNN